MKESYVVNYVYGSSCDLKDVKLVSPSNLSTVLASTIPPYHTTPSDIRGKDLFGEKASFMILASPKPHVNDTIPSNEFLAKKAHKNKNLKTSFLSIGNKNDFVFNVPGCTPAFPGFVDTQWLADRGKGSGIYGRFFTTNYKCPPLNDPKLKDIVLKSHLAVLSEKTVQTAIQSFLKGDTPSSLKPMP